MEQLVSMIRFPMFLNLQDQNIFLCGDDIELLDKIGKMKEFSPNIYVFSNRSPSIFSKIDGINLIHRFLEEEDFQKDPVFVIASCEEENNRRIWKMCKNHRVPVNIVDHPKMCDFTFPALVTTEKVCVGISSGGFSPTAAVHLKNEIETLLPSQMDDILESMVEIRTWVQTWCKERTKRNEVLKRIVAEAFQNNRPLTKRELQNIKKQFI